MSFGQANGDQDRFEREGFEHGSSKNGPIIAIIGAGPRGTSVLERIVAHAREMDSQGHRPVTVHVIDPYEPGSGQVWRNRQSPLLLMNTQPGDQTIYPDTSATYTPRGTGPDMVDWLRGVAAGNSDEPADIVAEAQALGPSSFPSRRLYGAYLRAAYSRIVAAAGRTVQIHRHTACAQSLHDTRSAFNDTDNDGDAGTLPDGVHSGDGRGTKRGTTRCCQLIRLDDGTELAVSHVVLALGHLPASLTPMQRTWRDFASAHDLVYQPPALPADVAWEQVAPPGARVICRGIALNFFDIAAMVTEGRGGRFVREGARLGYEASGREPVLIAGSRRGLPYRAKPIVEGVPRPKYHHRYFTASALEQLRIQEPSRQLNFNRDVFDLLHRDAQWIYYATLARTDPAAIAGNAEELFSHLDHAPIDDDWDALTRRIVPAEHRFGIHRLINPAAGLEFNGYDAWHEWMLDFLDADAAEARRGADSPVKMAALALYSGREMVKRLVLLDYLEPASFLDEVRGWFEDVAQTVGSGPPVRRIEEMAALARCGLVKFIGPRMEVSTRDGDRPEFVASSPTVADSEFTATRLAEALAPANRVGAVDDSLLRGLLDAGAARPKHFALPDLGTVTGTGLDVTDRPHRLIDAVGRVHPRRYAIGLQLSSVEWGTAIAATPDTNAITLADADAIARDVLSLPRVADELVTEMTSRVSEITEPARNKAAIRRR